MCIIFIKSVFEYALTHLWRPICDRNIYNVFDGSLNFWCKIKI